MKIYIVTTGCYSDYSIDRVFTNKEKAEEYAEWLEDSNSVEEYEADDDISFDKSYRINVQLKAYDDGREELNCYVSKTVRTSNKYVYLSDYHKYGSKYIIISMVRFVTNENFNEEFYRNKYTKAMYDILAIVKNYLAIGYIEREINELLNNKINIE